MGLFSICKSCEVKRIGLPDVDVNGGLRSTGALIAKNRGGQISHSYATGSVTNSGADLGGLAGNNTGSIRHSNATGNIDGGYNVGGLVGNNTGSIGRSYSTGDITTEGYNVGGLVGNNSGTVTQSYTTGNVDAESYDVGGLVGNNSGTVTQSYAIGSVEDTDSQNHHIGGLAGENSAADVAASVTVSYWNTETSAQSESAGGEGKTTAQLQGVIDATGIYANWSAAVWDFGTASEYPTLK